MTLRLTKIDEFQLLTCLRHGVWGSRSARFKDWQPGDFLGVIVDKALAGLANVSGAPFVSRERVWDNGLFPHRIPIEFAHVMLPKHRLPILGEVRDVLTSSWGINYGWGILNQGPLEGMPAETIVKLIRSCPNDLAEYKENLERYLDEAKRQRESRHALPKRVTGRGQKVGIKRELDESVSPKDDSAHSRVQRALVQIGLATGCKVWIASNDRNKVYKGKPLGDGCLRALPTLGLSDEATKRISLVDIIWLRQNAPLCAFEVEATTSIYSGLLRMADLIAEVPALNVKLYIVAPVERQDKVLAEMTRPAFRKIGLSEYCRFIPTENLDSLLAKVEDLRGHVEPSAIDSIAIEPESEATSALE